MSSQFAHYPRHLTKPLGENPVHPLIEANAQSIGHLCQRHGVRRLDVFGSAASGLFDSSRSDIDFVVEFTPEAKQRAFDNYFGLLEDLEKLLQRPVDLLTADSIRNPILKRSIDQQREIVFG